MNLSVDELRIKNFVTLADQTIPLRDQGIVLLKGKNLDEPWRGRNACGKTLVGDALLWLFQGETSRDITADSVIGKHGRSCSVEGDITLGSSKLSIGRYRKHPEYGNSMKLFEGGDVSHRRIKETQDRLDDTIGCSMNLLRLACFQYGDHSKYFSRMKSDQRSKIIDEIIGASDSNIPVRYKEINAHLRSIETNLLSAESKRSSDRSMLDHYRQTISVNRAALKQAELEMDDKIKSISSAVEEPDIERMNKCEKEILKYTDELNAPQINLAPKIMQLEIKERQLYSNLSTFKSDAQRAAKEFGLKAGEACLTCGNIITKDFIDVHKEEQQALINDLNIKIRKVQEEMLAVSVELKDLKYTKEQASEYRYQLKAELGKRQEFVRAQVKIIDNKRNMQAKIEEIKSALVSNINLLKNNIAEAQKKIENLLSGFQIGSVLSWKMEHELDTARILSEFYSPSGFRPLVMQHYSPIISDCANYFYSDFTAGAGKINIVSHSTLGNGKIVDKVDIDVMENDERKSFPGEWSLGEGGCIDLSINLGIMKLAMAHAAKDFNFMVLDEITNSLSEPLIKKLIKVLKQKVLHSGMTIIFTSHFPIPESEFSQVWTVEKSGGISKIYFESR